MAVAVAWTAAPVASAQTSRPPDELLDRMVGTWVLEGTIDGKATTHDVEYSCQWLDSTSNAGLSNGVVCRAEPSADELRLQFKYADGSTFHTTFSYDRKADNWHWKMDGEEKGQFVPFARVMLRRR
jgi:hypothetical protein